MSSENYDKNLNERVNRLEIEMEQMKSDIKTLEPLKEANVERKIQYDHIIETLEEVKQDVKTLQGKPSRVLDYIIMTVIASIVGYIVANLH